MRHDPRAPSSAFLRVTPFVCLTALVSCMAVPGVAASVTYTDQATFLGALSAGSYTNDFLLVPNATSAPTSSVDGTGGTPSATYSITAPTSGLGVFPNGANKAIGNWNSANNMVVTYTSNNVVGSGAEIWLSDINGTRLTGNITVDFSDGSQLVVPSTTTGAYGFAGATTDGPLATMTINAVSGLYLNMTNLTVSATAVPEPTTLAAIGLAATGLAGMAFRRRRK